MTGIFTMMYEGAERKSKDLAPLLGTLAAENRVGFLDAAAIVTASSVDGIHLEAEAHTKLGHAVAEAVVQSPSVAFV